MSTSKAELIIEAFGFIMDLIMAAKDAREAEDIVEQVKTLGPAKKVDLDKVLADFRADRAKRESSK